jgi:hypothetical protein
MRKRSVGGASYLYAVLSLGPEHEDDDDATDDRQQWKGRTEKDVTCHE